MWCDGNDERHTLRSLWTCRATDITIVWDQEVNPFQEMLVRLLTTQTHFRWGTHISSSLFWWWYSFSLSHTVEIFWKSKKLPASQLFGLFEWEEGEIDSDNDWTGRGWEKKGMERSGHWMLRDKDCELFSEKTGSQWCRNKTAPRGVILHRRLEKKELQRIPFAEFFFLFPSFFRWKEKRGQESRKKGETLQHRSKEWKWRQVNGDDGTVGEEVYLWRTPKKHYCFSKKEGVKTNRERRTGIKRSQWMNLKKLLTPSWKGTGLDKSESERKSKGTQWYIPSDGVSLMKKRFWKELLLLRVHVATLSHQTLIERESGEEKQFPSPVDPVS